MKKFIEFLEKNDAWNSFEKAFKESNQNVKRYKEIVKCNEKIALLAAFRWDETKEGADYWEDLNKKWEREYKPLKEQLLSDD